VVRQRERCKMAKEEKRKIEEMSERNSKMKKWVVGLLILLVLVFAGSKLLKWINTPTDLATETVEVNEEDWVTGAQQASVTILEYGDFQCPACASYHPLVRQLLMNFPEDLKVVYRHFPLSQHANAMPAGRAAEAAGMQGKFWEMHDMLFERQSQWSEEADPGARFESFAEELSLDLDRFKADYESDKTLELVQADAALGRAALVSSTPTFILNGQKISAPRTYEAFRGLVQDSLGE
jgi:protein-disulfide isomerase